MKELSLVSKMPAALDAEVKKIATLKDVAELRKRLVRALAITVEAVIRLAAIVRRLEELGDDLADIEISILPELRKVAWGQVVPELVVNLQGRPLLFRRASALPLPDQRKIADEDPIKVMEPGGDYRMVPPLKMTTADINQVFSTDHMRDEAEQASWLRDRQQRQLKLSVSDDGGVVMDFKRGGIFAGKIFISKADLAHYLSDLSAADNKRRRPVRTS